MAENNFEEVKEAVTEKVQDVVKDVEKAVDQTAKKVTEKAEGAKKTVKKATTKAKTAAKETAKKVTEKKPAAKRTTKAAKKELVIEMEVQGPNQNINVLEQIKEDWIAKGNKLEDIERIQTYVKLCDSAVYYVINGNPDLKGSVYY